ncbi:MAG: AgmX/PglI C-terminal domain-containing protein [bacterium]
MALRSEGEAGHHQPDTPHKEKRKLVLQLQIDRESGESEKLLLKKGLVTAGNRPGNDLVIPSPCPLKRFTFLKKKWGGGYELFIPGGMTGTICQPDQTESVTIDSLRRLNLLPRKDQGHILLLPVGSRAELSYETLRLTLEYVPMPPPPPRIKKPRAPKEPRGKQVLADGSKAGFFQDDQKGFWLMFTLSLGIHLLFFLYVQMVPLPSSPPRQATLDNIPERFVKLIISSEREESFPGQEKKEQEEIKTNTGKEEEKPAPSDDRKKESETPEDAKEKSKPTPPLPKKLSPEAETAAKDAGAGEKEEKAAQQGGAPSGTPVVASTEGLKDQDQEKENAPSPPPKKKVDLNSIGILGMISSRESSRASASPVDSQLNLLTKNAISGEDTLVRQIEKADSPKDVLAGGEPDDELLLGNGKDGETTARNDGKAREGDDGKESEESEKPDAPVSAQKIDDLVAAHQKTDNVQLPTRDDLALQKIVEVKTTGPKSQSRTPSAILDVVLSYKPSIVYCYNKALQQYSSLEGRLLVEFTITAQGEVSSAEVISSTFDKSSSSLEECMLSMIRSWRFAPVPAGSTTVVTYPFVFLPTL